MTSEKRYKKLYNNYVSNTLVGMGNTVSRGWEAVGTDVDVTIDEVMRNVCTGDIIGFSGQGWDAKLIRAASVDSRWSHVGPVVKVVDSTGKKRILITEA